MKQMNAKKAREEAERLHLQRLDQMRLEKEAKDKMEKEQMIAKRSGQKKTSDAGSQYRCGRVGITLVAPPDFAEISLCDLSIV